MALEKAVKFIKDSIGSNDIKEKLKGIDVSDKSKALQTITTVARELGYEFSPDEYEQAAKEMYLLYDVEHKGIEEICTNESESNCTCSGCAACAACTACLACISCSFCIVIPIAGEAVIAADAAGVISAAASLSTGVSTGVAVAAQGNYKIGPPIEIKTFNIQKILKIGHLSKSEPPRFGKRQVFYCNPFYKAVSQQQDLNFKIDTKIKTTQNRILNMKNGGIQTPSV